MRRDVRVPGGVAEVAFFLAAGPERDGAEATVGVMRRRGWRALLTATRDALRLLEQGTGLESLDALINRNLLFAYFYSVGRALDDAHFYLVRTRVPWHRGGEPARVGGPHVDHSRGAAGGCPAGARTPAARL
jgi:hypothetical protein